MRFTHRLGLKAAKLGLAMIVAALATSATSSKADAHFFRHHFGYYGYHGLGYHGWGYGYHGFGYRPWGGYYSSYYGFSSPYYYYSAAPVYYYRPRILPFRFCAPFLSVPVCSVSVETYVDPCDSNPAYSGAVSYEPAYAFASQTRPSSWTTSALAKSSSPMMNTLDAQRNAFAMQPRAVTLASAQKSTNLPLMMLRHPVASDVQAATAALNKQSEAGSRYVASKPAGLQPYSPIWTQAATGLVDDMVANGQLEDAAASCKSMEKIEQTKGAGVYLRQGLLSYMSNPNAGPAEADKALAFLDLACASGSQLQPSELAKDSLRDYLSACSTDVDQVLERLSQSILENPSKSGRELLLLTALLRMDGQFERAKLFAQEAEQMAAKSGAFHWNSLLAVCNE